MPRGAKNVGVKTPTAKPVSKGLWHEVRKAEAWRRHLVKRSGTRRAAGLGSRGWFFEQREEKSGPTFSGLSRALAWGVWPKNGAFRRDFDHGLP